MEFSHIKEVITPPEFLRNEELEYVICNEKMTETYAKLMIPLGLILLGALLL